MDAQGKAIKWGGEGTFPAFAKAPYSSRWALLSVV